MASLKFLTTNYIESATLENGTGGGAPALSETAPYLTSNTQKRSRRSIWQKPSAANIDIDFDLGSDKVLDAGGIGAHSPIVSGTAGIDEFTIKYATAASGYGPGPWTNAPGAVSVDPAGARDKVVDFSSQVAAARYIRFSLVVTTVFTLGKFVIGTYDYDLGVLFSSLERAVRSPNFEDMTIGEDPIVNYTGFDFEVWSLGWEDMSATPVAKIEAVRALRRSFWVADKDYTFREFIVSRSEMRRVVKIELSSDTIQDASIELRQLG